mgnify:CR=1 FL=1
MSSSGLNMSRRIRRTPYTDRVEYHGVKGFSVVNHMLLPKAYETTVEDDYWHLRSQVQLWDVAVQRQIQISGKDAFSLVQLMTPRDLSGLRVGECRYIPVIDENAGMLNDPVLLKLSEDKFWLSIADSDLLLWAKGLKVGMSLEAEVEEPDVSPLAIQGPLSFDLMSDLVGNEVRKLRHFEFGEFDILGRKQIIARSGYSKQGGFEIYLEGYSFGGGLWDLIWNAGQQYDIRPGCPNLIERIEGGLMSYGNEFTRSNNPLECGFGPICHLGEKFEYVGKTALTKIAKTGPTKMLCGVKFGGGKAPTCAKPFPVTSTEGLSIGSITSAIYSPRLKCNVGMSMIRDGHWKAATKVVVHTPDGMIRDGAVANFPL